MGQFVIAAYRPKTGQDEALRQLLREHMPILLGQSLVTDRPAYLMRAQNGTYLEVFEWKSAKAVEQAHQNPVVLAMWERFGAACEYESLTNLEECRGPFPNFPAVEL